MAGKSTQNKGIYIYNDAELEQYEQDILLKEDLTEDDVILWTKLMMPEMRRLLA